MSCLAPARTDPGAAAGLARFGPQSPDFSSYPSPLVHAIFDWDLGLVYAPVV
mgnify:CR=1 FL=1